MTSEITWPTPTGPKTCALGAPGRGVHGRRRTSPLACAGDHESDRCQPVITALAGLGAPFVRRTFECLADLSSLTYSAHSNIGLQSAQSDSEPTSACALHGSRLSAHITVCTRRHTTMPQWSSRQRTGHRQRDQRWLQWTLSRHVGRSYVLSRKTRPSESEQL